MKTDCLFTWGEHVTRRSRWRLRILLPAFLLLIASGAAQAVNGNYVTDGDFEASCVAPFTSENFDPSNPVNTGQWLSQNNWTRVANADFDGVATNCYAKQGVNGRQRLFQAFTGPTNTGTFSVSYDYVIEYTNANLRSDPYFWVLGVNSVDNEIAKNPLSDDGFPQPAGGPDITDWDVLYQKKLAGNCPLTDCADEIGPPVGAPGSPVSISTPFHVPAAYDYWVVIITSGCTDNATDLCDTTLRGLDDVSITLVEPDEEGPLTTYLKFEPNAAIVNLPFAITALVSDAGRGDSNIASAEYKIVGEVDWTDMNALDGAFDSPLEPVTVLAGGLSVGTYEICVRGTDAGNNVGPEDCNQLVVYNPIADSGGLNIPVSNQCAQFYTLENPDSDHEITTLNYGETIIFDTDFHINSALDIPDGRFKFHAQAKGDGVGATSDIKYQFKLNSMLKAEISPYFDPATFDFTVRAKIVGQAQEVDGYGILNGAQNNAELVFKLRIRYESYRLSIDAFDFSVECAGDPWTNVTENWNADTNEPVGNGFGDPWNKYIWSMEEFKGGVFAGTKNATYNLQSVISPSIPVATCLADPTVPEPYRPFACLELFGNTGDRDSRGGEIWRFDLKKKRWTLVEDSEDPTSNDSPQGFRDMVVHNGKLYVAADLGAFISGVTYNIPFNPPFTYPGVTLLVSEDGVNFAEVDGCDTDTGSGDILCRQGATVAPGTVPDVNISIRALASAGGDLYIGTFNADTGGQVWRYDGTTFDMIWDTGSSLLPIVGEIEEYDGKLYVGIGGDPSELETQSGGGPNNYLFECELGPGCDAGVFTEVAGLPDIDPNTFFVIKLFVGKGQLWLGTANFAHGFSLLSYDGTDWDIVVDGPNEGGFFNPYNIYDWAMAEVDGRLFMGTGNELLIDELPRGEAELWYTDDGIDWFEYPLPIDWGYLNYGIRSMDFAGRKLFLGSASNMVAPDALYPGGQVWTIRDTKVNSPSGGGGSKGNGRKTH